ncbi:serpin family protein [Thermococcus aggregans]|uniref:Serpin family protein n=1 Tax=Thermococcus aggregans TaxID=110163 RepID=A0A9E7SPK0_THEAG|nr:serpin family protein [Thermococcus aggregans]USS41276.1 serpin family protein [Thermococcus aggregans]
MRLVRKIISPLLVLILVGIMFASGCINTNFPSLSYTESTSVVPYTHNDTLRYKIPPVNDFAFLLYHHLPKKEDNIFLSPYSILTALAMLYEGAEGTTRNEMREVLNLPEDDLERREEFRYLILRINNPASDAYILRTASALWIQKDYSIKEDYIDVIRRYYFADVRELDFSEDPEGSRKTINEWVERQTERKIANLIPPGAIDEFTRLVITNAIYFKANWSSKFEPENTYNETFTLTSGEKIKVEMMHQVNSFNYMETEEFQALEMPYKDNRLSMLIILPKENDISVLEEKLTSEFVENILSSMKVEKVEVVIPKFSFEKSYILNDVLQEMGIREAFTNKADFSGIAEDKLMISVVVHKTFIRVAESGTEAAAATGVGMTVAAPSSKEHPKVFRADHPFIFLIRDRETGAVLFIGRLMDPRG